jgi:hypothetical protein
VQQPKHNF